MAIEVKIPTLGESISSGILATWHVKDGDQVEKDQLLYELETDKITSEGNAEVAGKVSLKVKEGDEVDVGQVVAEIEEGASDGSPEDASAKGDDGGDEEGAPDLEEEGGSEDPSQSKPSPAVSPAVRRIAEETGIDPAGVKGTGKDGRVTKGDMLKAAESREKESSGEEEKESPKASAPAVPPEASAPDVPAARGSGGSSETRRKMSSLRRSIAQRLVAAKNETAMLTTFNEVDMSAVINLRKRYQESFVERYGIKLGFMSVFIKAVVQALREVPQLNAMLDGDEIVEHHFYDIGVAVSTEKGLMVPVLRDCDQLSFDQIEASLADYAKRARDGKIQIDDLKGGVFSITNGGIFGSLLSTPILNPPQSAILGMHTIQERPVAVDGKVEIRPMMYLALSYDHRIVDGREAVTFLVKVKQAIEDPSRLLFGV